MHPSIHAASHPDKPACIMAGSGAVTTFRQLDEGSNRGAHLFRSLGLKTGDVIAAFLYNTARYFEVAWAAQRAGLYFTCISSKLTAGEVEYIVRDSGAKVLISTRALAPVCDEVAARLPDLAFFGFEGRRPPIATGTKPVPPCPQPRLPMKLRARTCFIHRAPPAGPRG